MAGVLGLALVGRRGRKGRRYRKAEERYDDDERALHDGSRFDMDLASDMDEDAQAQCDLARPGVKSL